MNEDLDKTWSSNWWDSFESEIFMAGKFISTFNLSSVQCSLKQSPVKVPEFILCLLSKRQLQ